MTKREEVAKKYKRLGWAMPARFDRLSDSAVQSYLNRANEALDKKNRHEPYSKNPPPELSPEDAPSVPLPIVDDLDDLTGCEDEIKTKTVLPDLVEECAEHLRTALRLFIRRRMWLSSHERRDDPEVKEYLAQAKKAVARAACCVVTCEGNGYERGSKMMQLFDMAITEMRNEFTDALVSTAVMNTVLSDKHQMEMERARRG